MDWIGIVQRSGPHPDVAAPDDFDAEVPRPDELYFPVVGRERQLLEALFDAMR